MNSLATLRQRQTPWARRVVGIFVVVWLNLALQPCAMAMGGGDDHDCPHCPTSHTRQHDGHEMSSDEMKGHEMTGHDMPCAMGAADCSVLDTAYIDSRTGQFKLKDGPSDLPATLIPSAPWLANTSAERVTLVAPFATDSPGTSPPLNILYCVYLD